jgi:uncharacterized protein YqgV (UPF0045/DUF77 family)
MIIQAEVSLYPLRAEKIGPVLEQFLDTLRTPTLVVELGSMSTRVRGETHEVFASLDAAFSEVLENNEVVLIVKASNACPTESGKS